MPDLTITEEQLSKLMEDTATKVLDSVKDKIAPQNPPKPLDEDKLHQEVFGFKGLSDFAKAVMVGGDRDPRLRTMQEKTLQIGSHGEYLIPPVFANEILKTALDSSIVFSRCRNLPLSTGNSFSIPYMVDKNHTSGNLFGGVVCYWTEASGTISASDLKFGKVNLNLHKLAGLIPVEQEFIDDAPFAVDVLLRDVFGQAVGFQLDDKVINGNGAGQPLGIMNSPALVSVAKVSGQATATLVAQNLFSMLAKMPAANRKNAIWLYTPLAFAEFASMYIGGDSLGVGGKNIAQELVVSNTLLGKPALACEHLQALGTTGDILLIDPTQYLTLTKGGLKFDSSMHLYFDTDRQAFRITYRVDGAPWWETYLTLANSVTQSAFVKLDTRS